MRPVLDDSLAGAPIFVAKQTGTSDINAMHPAEALQGVGENVAFGRTKPEVSATAHFSVIPTSPKYVVDLLSSPSNSWPGSLHMPETPQPAAVSPGALAPGDEANGKECGRC
eukprot:RCo015159